MDQSDSDGIVFTVECFSVVVDFRRKDRHMLALMVL